MADWENVGRIKGEDGKDGEKGEKGDKGDKGDTGAPMIIEGSVASEEDLPSQGQLGQAYIVDGDLYVWK